MDPVCHCACGHLEKKHLVKTVGEKTLCNECWRNYREKAGLVDEGCIFPNAEVCMDREPIIFQYMGSEKTQKAKCYRGHNDCIKNEAENILPLLRKKEGKSAICPIEGCDRLLTEVKTEYYISLVCPVHGVISKAVPERDEGI